MKKVAIFLMGVSCLLFTPAAAVFSAPAKEGQIMLVITAPWHSAQEVISLAGADLVDPEKAPLGAFAATDTFDLEKRLKHAGAWVVLDAQIISRLMWDVIG